jgi:hypothetical protein
MAVSSDDVLVRAGLGASEAEHNEREKNSENHKKKREPHVNGIGQAARAPRQIPATLKHIVQTVATVEAPDAFVLKYLSIINQLSNILYSVSCSFCGQRIVRQNDVLSVSSNFSQCNRLTFCLCI